MDATHVYDSDSLPKGGHDWRCAPKGKLVHRGGKALSFTAFAALCLAVLVPLVLRDFNVNLNTDDKAYCIIYYLPSSLLQAHSA